MRKTLIILSLLFGVFVFAQNIEYPVAELDNCGNREECYEHCDDLSNLDACLRFAEDNNLFTDQELNEAKKIIALAERGIGTPGDCSSKTDCDVYCSQRENVRECFNFGKEAGLIPPEEIEKAEKAIDLIEQGGSPGGCVTKQECDSYCSLEENLDECIDFAVKTGLMDEKEAEMAKKTGGKGPGGCQSKEECDAFCRKPENQKICFDFAKEHNLISQEQIAETMEGIKITQEKLQEAPDEVLSCLNDALGSEMVSNIKSGDFLPNPEIGEAMKPCFEEYYSEELSPEEKEMMEEAIQDMQKTLQEAPDEVLSCLNDVLGSETVSNIKSGDLLLTPEIGEAMKPCFEEHPSKEPLPEEKAMMEEAIQEMQEKLQEAPPEVMSCLNNVLGSEMVNNIKSGDFSPTPEIAEAIGACFEEHFSKDLSPEEKAMMEEAIRAIQEKLQEASPEIMSCINDVLGSEMVNNIKSGDFLPAPEIAEAIGGCFEAYHYDDEQPSE